MNIIKPLESFIIILCCPSLSGDTITDSLIIVLSGFALPQDVYSPHTYIKYNYLQQTTSSDGEGNILGYIPQFINPTTNTDFVDNWQDYDWDYKQHLLV